MKSTSRSHAKTRGDENNSECLWAGGTIKNHECCGARAAWIVCLMLIAALDQNLWLPARAVFSASSYSILTWFSRDRVRRARSAKAQTQTSICIDFADKLFDPISRFDLL